MSKNRTHLRPASRAMALEPRILFDGAGAIAATDVYTHDLAHAYNDHSQEAPAATPAAIRPATDRPVDLDPGRVPSNDAGLTLLVVDARVADYQQLLTDLPANVVVRVVGENESGLAAVSQALQAQQGSHGVASIQIISHGTPGSFSLGSDAINATTLSAQSLALQSWAGALTADADILLYGCDVGQGAQGQALITQLASLTGADIAASIDPTGAAAKGGNWVLETSTGSIEAGLALSAAAMHGYADVLAAPTIGDTGGTRTTAEDNSSTITGITIADTDSSNSQTVTITATNGVITLAATAGTASLTGNGTSSISFVASAANATAAMNGMVFQPTKDFAGAATFTVATDDGTTSVSLGAKTITVTANATAPVLTLPAFSQTVAEDTPAYFNFNGTNAITLTDADANDLQTLTLTVAHGTLTVTPSGGSSITSGNGTATVVLSGTAAQLSATLASPTGVQYSGALNYNSSYTTAGAETLSFTLSDGVAAHNQNGVLALNVTPVNDNPDLSTKVNLVLKEGNTQAFSLAQLASSSSALDVDIQTGQQVLVQQMLSIKSLPTATGDAGGTLTYKNGPVVVGSVIPLSDIANLKFTHNGTDITARQTATFNVEVTDGGGTTGVVALSVNIDPKNVAPTIDPLNTSVPISINEGQSKVVKPTYDLGDAFDTTSNSTFSISAINNGTISATGPAQGYFFFDTDGNGLLNGAEAKLTANTGSLTLAQLDTLRFRQEGGEPNTPGSVAPSYALTITDAGGGEGAGAALSVTKVITLNVLPNNDQPVVSNGLHATTATALTVNERSTTVITTAMLQVTDPDLNPADPSQAWPAANLVYTLAAPPTHGELLLEVKAGVFKSLDVGGRFTQADIDAGKVKYSQTENITGSTAIPEVFTFTVRDSSFGYELPTPDSLGAIVPGAVRDGDVATGAIKTLEFHLNLTPDPSIGTGTAPTFDTITYDFSALGTNSNGFPSGWSEGNFGNAGLITQAMLEYKITRTIGGEAVLLPPAETVYTLTAVPSNGIVERQVSPGVWKTLSVSANFTQADINSGNIRFTHDGNEDFVNSFGFTVSDGTANGSLNRAFTINTAPVNDRPTGTGGSANVTEGSGNTVRLDSGVLSMSDVDGSTDTETNAKNTTGNVLWNDAGNPDQLWFKITSDPTENDGTGTAHGKFQYWNGTTWTDIVAGADVWLSKSILTATADGGTSGLRYVHDGSEPLAYAGGTPKLAFNYVVRDDLGVPTDVFTPNTTSVTDLGTNQSAAIKATIGIIAVNDAPQVANKPGDSDPTISATIASGGALTGINQVLTVLEGTSVKITSADLTAVDRDNTTTQRQFSITAIPTLGSLILNGSILGVGSTFTQADIDSGKLEYRHTGTEPLTATTDTLGTYNDKFHFVVNDGVLQDSGTGASNYNTFLISLTSANDKPTVTGPNGTITLDRASANPVAGFSVDDPDFTNTANADFLQVTVRLQDSTGTPVSNYATGFAGAGVSIKASTTGLTVTQDGTNNILQFQGTKTQIDAALAGLNVTFTNDPNAFYKLEVIVDDRTRDGTGALVTTGNDANGGDVNQPATVGGATTPVPNTVYDWATTATVPAGSGNIASKTVDLRVSQVNEIPVFTAPSTFTVNEDVRSAVGDGTTNKFVVSDAESRAFNTPVTVTVSVPASQGTLNIGATGTTTSFTPAGGQSVTIGGQGSGTLTLTGRADDIQAVLNGRNFDGTIADASTGVYYTSASNANHDQNTTAAGDVTLTLNLTEGTSAIGSNVGSGSVANTVAAITTGLDITAINDAPTVNRTAATVAIAGTGATAVSGFSITDVDSNNGYIGEETDGVIQATVRVLNASNVPLTQAQYTSFGITLDSSTSGTAGAAVDTTLNGSTQALELRGTLTQINAYLVGLRVTFADLANANTNTNFSIEVVADDRIRDVTTGVLTNLTTPVANGGVLNQQTGLPVVPATDTFDAYTTVATTYSVFDVARNTRPLLISAINDPGNITAANVTVNEGSATLNLSSINGNFTLADPDDNGATTMTTTVTVGVGTITAVGGAGGTVGGTGTNTITISGATEAQINSRLQALTVTFPDVDGAGVATSANWNGSFDVTVVYNDKGNTGTRPSDLTGTNDTTLDSTDARTSNGDFMFADGTTNNLVTTRIITVTVTGVNDAPTSTSATTTLPAATEDTTGGVGDTITNLFGGTFSDAKDAITGGSSAGSFAGIAITTNNAIAAQGKWQYSTDNGTTWTDLPVVSTTSALLLDSNAKLHFSPAANFQGTPGSLVTRLIDNSGAAFTSGTTTADVSNDTTKSGGATPYSDSSNTVTLGTTVTNVNDRPTGTAGTLTATEDLKDAANVTGKLVSALGTVLGYSDVTDNQSTGGANITGGGNAATTFGGLAITGNSTNATTEGTWQYSTNGTTWSDVSTTGLSNTAALILPTTASLRFNPSVLNVNGTIANGLTVLVADTVQTFATSSDISAALGTTSTWSDNLSLKASLTPQNDAPAFTNTATNPTATEAAGTASTTNWVKLLNSGTNTVSDIDLTTTAALSSTVLGQGSVTVSLTSGMTGDTLRLNTLVAGANGISTITGGSNGAALVVSFTNAATLAQAQAVLEAIEYRHNGDDPTNIKSGTARSSLDYTIVLNDGNNVQAGTGKNAGGPLALTDSKSGTITLSAVNDPPVAVNDTNEVTEDSGTASTGNVKTGIGSPNTTTDSDPDNTTAQLTVTDIRTGPETGGTPGTVATIAAGTTSATGTSVVGQYGTLTIGIDGSYSYVLDNNNATVNALNSGDTLSEQFTYTLQDPAGLSDTAQLTITIKGNNDGGPTIVPVDGNSTATGQVTVFEAGLTTVPDTSETNTGTITLTASTGLASIEVGGTLVPLADLNSLSTTPVVITTTNGKLTLTGFTATTSVGGIPTVGTLSYSYTLNVAQTTPSATESTQTFALKITDAATISNTGTLTVRIVDDVPTANPDTNSIDRTDATVTGNAFTTGAGTDRIGADGAATGGPVTGVKAGSDTSTAAAAGVATSVTGTYGAIKVAADGSYTYTLDTANATVAALATGATLTDTYTYTITDKDGDTSTTTITITINGRSVPVAVADTLSVNEDATLTGNLASNDTPSADGGNGWTKATDPTHGTVTVNTDGTFTYNPTGNYNGSDSFTYTITDSNGDKSTATASITVKPLNDTPAFTNTATDPTSTEAAGTASTTNWVKLLNTGTNTVSDIDLTTTAALTTGVFGQGSVTVSLTSGITGDTLQLNTLIAGADGISAITGGSNGTALVINFTNAATLAQAQAVLEAIEYRHNGDDPTNIKSGTARSSLDYTIVLNDGNNVQVGTGNNAGGPSALEVSKAGTITMVAVNDPPVATDNTNSVTEDATPASVTGNVRTDGTVDSDPDNVIADLSLSSIRTGPETGGTPGTAQSIAAGSTSAATGTTVTGLYGTLTIGADGSYSYALDNTNTTVNALSDGDTLTEVFTYTLKDPAGLSDTAALTITINGHTDGAPQITSTDGNAGATGQATVYEKGLLTAGDTTETTIGSINVKAPDGIKSVTIGGTTFTVAELQALSITSPSAGIDTGEGTLTITGITGATGPTGAPIAFDVTYSYILKATITNALPADTESTDTITLGVTDTKSTAGTASGTLTVQIIDDTPSAAADTNSITKGNTTVTGNAFTNDTIGADGPPAVNAPVTGITGGTAGTALNGTYGAITLNADGTYTYALDNTNSVVAGLLTGQTKVDTFTYTITDKDGDTSTATIKITINGVTPNAVPVAVNDAFTLNEDTSLSDTLKGNDSPSADGGNVWTKTTDPTHGTVVVNTDGTFVYTPTANYNGSDSFTYTITDGDGDKSTATVTLTVTSVNDLPVAVADNTTTPKDTAVSGTLVGNDTPSGDGGNVWTKATDPTHGAVVVKSDGTYTYTPSTGFSGTDTFTYTITDKDGDKSTATVTITVESAAVLPVTPPVEPPVGPPVEPPVIPPVVSSVLEPGQIMPESQPNVPAPILQPLNPLQRDPVREPSVFFDGAVFNDVPRLSIPLHPIVYVTPQVAASQAERERSDPLFYSNPQAVQHGGVQSSSIGAGLGMDPTVFVQTQVRRSQSYGELVGDIVDGRLPRISLSSDGRIATPEWFNPDAEQIVPDMPGEAQTPTPPEPQLPTAERVVSPDVVAVEQVDRSLVTLTSSHPAPRAMAAPSFSEQLRHAGARSPVAARAAIATPFVS